MQLTGRIAVLLVGSLAPACTDPTSPAAPAPAEIRALPRSLSAAEQEIVDATRTFAFHLLSEVNEDWQSRNLFISPLSASMALAMTMNGTAGATLDQLRQVLGLGTRPLDEINAGYQGLIALLHALDPGVTFELANAIWYDRKFEPYIQPVFLQGVPPWFDAEVSALDFGTPESVAAINDWAKRHTHGRIDRVIDDTGNFLVMVLANAIYFNGAWREQFDKAQTSPRPFTLQSGERVPVPTMYREGAMRLGRMSNALVVELPYGGNAFAMTILLPDVGVDVNGFTTSLTPAEWRHAIDNLLETDSEIFLPKFTMEWADSLEYALQRMGMVDAFQSGVADFTPLSAERGRTLYVQFVRQNTFVDVNEEGTEAAAVTTVGVADVSRKLPPTIDRPFVFTIRERLSGTILFMGKLVDPR